MRELCVGILTINGTAMTTPGSLLHPSSLPCPVLTHEVPEATPDRILGPWSLDLEAALVRGARTLAHQGATHITTNCGFAILYQGAVAAATRLPTMLSSLLFLPMLGSVYGPRLGLLTYDAGRLTREHLLAAGCSRADGVTVDDVSASFAWKALGDERRPHLEVDAMRTDLLLVARQLANRAQAVALLLECTGMCPFALDIEDALGVPVFDHVRLLGFALGPTACSDVVGGHSRGVGAARDIWPGSEKPDLKKRELSGREGIDA